MKATVLDKWCVAAVSVAAGLAGLVVATPAAAQIGCSARMRHQGRVPAREGGHAVHAGPRDLRHGGRRHRTRRGLGAPNQMRYYAVCRAAGMVQVTYNPRDRVVSKSGSWYQ